MSQGVSAFLEIVYLAGKELAGSQGVTKVDSQHWEMAVIQDENKTHFHIPSEKTSTAGHQHMFWLVLHSCVQASSLVEEKIVQPKIKYHNILTLLSFLICMTYFLLWNIKYFILENLLFLFIQ